ncbi:lyase precursor [Kribbella antibiotica]|uniref:Lyase n=1 Tax=Kribbella antibiotica TaxID=190195 RepID=A0A4R4ZUD7_9ACTN|nr:polysaccharide lyase 6 family protein [Kribbella antibiotica]TDD61976.1 lyase precursor [Kribbella antibiotica]
MPLGRRTFLTATLATTAALAGTSSARAATQAVQVQSIDALRQAIASAQPGAEIVLANGTYTVSGSQGIPVSGRHGTAAAPIVVRAASVGGVTLNGDRGFVLANSSYIVLSGFKLRQKTTFEIPTTCTNIRISRNDIQVANTEGVNYVVVRADNTVVERNHFHHKSTLGVFLAVEGPGSAGMARGVRIVRNYFADHTYGGANGGEPIRLGLSGRSLSDAAATVEENLFERCNGDPEAISTKSSGNLIRANTIRNSVGGIVLRHGNGSRVEGNFVVAGGNGIRIYGNDHLVVNNYLENLTLAGIVLGSGNVKDHKPEDSAESRKGNDAPDRVTIALNTVLSSPTAISGESIRTIAPAGCVIADNLLVGEAGRELVSMPYLQGITWSGNILWGAAGNGNIPAGGFSRQDPKLANFADGVKRLGAGSPAIDAASRTYSSVSLDLDGQPRSGRADVGADEYTAVTPATRKLYPADVGPAS